MKDFYNDKARELFGLEYLFPWQRLVVANILEGLGYFGEERQEEAPRRNLVILPTGAGKTLCFLMPALMVEGITLILYPLLALLNDQARRLKEGGYDPVLFRGGQSRGEREKLWRILEEGKSRFILTNPETAGTKEFQARLFSLPVVHLVVDEAHTIVQWGASFRQGLLAAGDLAEKGNFPVVSAFTATASPEYQDRIGELIFRNRPFQIVAANPDRANIRYHVLYSRFMLSALEELCRREAKPILVFCRTRARAEDTARYLDRRAAGQDGIGGVRFYHAGLTREEKEEAEAWFLGAEEGILCSTSAFGMGTDHRSLETVIHRDIPYSMESYIQEAGRAGRSGQEARAFLLASPGQGGEGPVRAYVRTLNRCRRTMLMESLGREIEYCGGCDHCTPGVFLPLTDRSGEELNKILNLYSRALTLKEWIDFLKGYLRGPFRFMPGYGLLRNWDRDCIEMTFSDFEKEGLIYVSDRGLWKNRVFVKGEL